MSTAETIERSRYAEKLGFDGLLVISPWYQVHTQREIYAHFKALRDAVSLPIMIYNNPPVTGLELGIDLLERLTNDGIIQYIKDANSDPYMLSRLKMRLGDKLHLFYGHDNNAIGAFAFGATGWYRAHRISTRGDGPNSFTCASTTTIMYPHESYGTKSCPLLRR
jgi:4-hydroxy-tetrahydrodipicolinate synthase